MLVLSCALVMTAAEKAAAVSAAAAEGTAAAAGAAVSAAEPALLTDASKPVYADHFSSSPHFKAALDIVEAAKVRVLTRPAPSHGLVTAPCVSGWVHCF